MAGGGCYAGGFVGESGGVLGREGIVGNCLKITFKLFAGFVKKQASIFIL